MKSGCAPRDKRLFAALPWVLMQGIVCALLLTAWGPKERTAYSQETSRRYIVVLVDESDTIRGNEDSDLNANDPDNRRTRFTRFLVRYLQAFEQDTEVGVIGFVAKPVTVTHLMPVEQWSRADLQSLERLLTQSTEQEGHTSFQPALQAAQASLRTRCNDENPSNQCQVVLFTDGLWETDLTQETGAVVSSTLQALRQEGTSVVVVLLAGDPIPGRYAAGDYLRIWEAGSTAVISNATEMSAQAVYQGVLEGLGLDEPLDRLSVREFTATTVVTAPVFPFQRYMHFFLLADNPVAETWTPSPNVQVGVDRWWFDPPVGEIQGTLMAGRGAAQTMLVYYEVLSETYPIRFQAHVMPDCVALGQATMLDGWFTAGGQVVSGTAGFSVQATVNGEPVSLAQQADGHFTQVLTTAIPGEHGVAFHPIVPEFVEPGAIDAISRTFYAEALPRLHLSMETPKQVTTSTIPLAITVTIENIESVRGIITPTLTLVEQQKLLILSPVGHGEFATATEVISGTRNTIQAHLAGGWTKHGLYFEDQEDEQAILIPRPRIVLVRRPMDLREVVQVIVEQFPGLLVLVLLLPVGGAVALLLAWRAVKNRKFRLSKLKDVLARPRNEITRENIIKVFKESDHFESGWREFARDLSDRTVRTLCSAQTDPEAGSTP